MKKVKTLTNKEWHRISNANKKDLIFKRIMRLDGKYFIGDTFATIDSPEMLGVYKHIENGRVYWYIVVNVINNHRAFTWSLFKASK